MLTPTPKAIPTPTKESNVAPAPKVILPLKIIIPAPPTGIVPLPMPRAVPLATIAAIAVPQPTAIAAEPVVLAVVPAKITPAWQKCVDALSTHLMEQLAVWREFTVEFCQKLKENRLIGIFNNRIAFPIAAPSGEVTACHHRPLAGEGEWCVTPFKGTKAPMFPLIVNDPLSKDMVAVFESQWDALAFMNMADWHNGGIDEIGCIATRGASNGGRIKDYCRPGARIIAFSQNDEAGQKWLSRVVKAARGEVSQVVIPPGIKDFNDWTRAGATLEDIETAILNGPVLKPIADVAQNDGQECEPDSAQAEDAAYEGIKPLETTKDGRILVLLPRENRLLSEFAADMGRALADTDLYSRTNYPFVVNHANRNLKLMTAESFRTWSEQHAVCFHVDRSDDGPPLRIKKTMAVTEATAVLASGQFLKRLRPIRKLNQVRLPVLRQSGVIELLPVGYDAESQTFTFDSGLQYDESMSPATAKAVIDGLFSEFCFQEENGRSLAVAIAGMMTVFAHSLLPQTALVPCFIVMANAEGAGKTLLVKVLVVPVYGNFIAGTKPTNEEELRKRLTAAVMEASPYVCFDNVKEHLDSGSLEAFLTTSIWSDRILGSSKNFSGEKNTVVFATGNACTVSPDMRRRSLLVQLFMKEERAEARQFRRLLDVPYLIERRGEILSALWVMVKMWVANGKPAGSKTHSSFPEWAKTIAPIVENAGYSSPVVMPDIDCAADRDGEGMRLLVNGLAPGVPMRIFTFTEFVEYARQVGAFESIIGSEGDLDRKANTIFGRALKRYDRRFVGDYMFLVEGQGHARKYVFKKADLVTTMPQDLQSS